MMAGKRHARIPFNREQRSLFRDTVTALTVAGTDFVKGWLVPDGISADTEISGETVNKRGNLNSESQMVLCVKNNYGDITKQTPAVLKLLFA
jgi:hypothetical protein